MAENEERDGLVSEVEDQDLIDSWQMDFDRKAQKRTEEHEEMQRRRGLGSPSGARPAGRPPEQAERHRAAEEASPLIEETDMAELAETESATRDALVGEILRGNPEMEHQDALDIANKHLDKVRVTNPEFVNTPYMGTPTRYKPSAEDLIQRYRLNKPGIRRMTSPNSPASSLYDAIDQNLPVDEIESLLEEIDESLLHPSLTKSVPQLVMAYRAFGRRAIDITEPSPTWQTRQEERRKIAREIDRVMRDDGIVPAMAMAAGKQTLMTQEQAESLGFDMGAIERGGSWIDATVGLTTTFVSGSLMTGKPQRALARKLTGTSYLLPYGRSGQFTGRPISYMASRFVETMAAKGETPMREIGRRQPQTAIGKWLYQEPKAFDVTTEKWKGGKLPARNVLDLTYVDPRGVDVPGMKGKRKFYYGRGGALAVGSLFLGAIGYAVSRTSRTTPDFWRPIPLGDNGLLGQIKAPQGLVDFSSRMQILTGIADLMIPVYASTEEDAEILQEAINRARPAETWNAVIDSVRVHLERGMTPAQASVDPDVRDAVRHLIMNLSYAQMPKHVQRGEFDVAKFKRLALERYSDLTAANSYPALRSLIIAVENRALTDRQIERTLKSLPIGQIALHLPELLVGLIPSEQSFMEGVLLAAGADTDMIYSSGGRTTVPATRNFGQIMMDVQQDDDGKWVVVESTLGRLMRVAGGIQELYLEIPLGFTPAGRDFRRPSGTRVRDPNTSYLARVLSNIYTGEMGLARHETDLMYAAGVDRNSGQFLFWSNFGILMDWMFPWEKPFFSGSGALYRTGSRGVRAYRYWKPKEGQDAVSFRMAATMDAMFPSFRSRRFNMDLENVRAVHNIQDILEETGATLKEAGEDLDDLVELERMRNSDDQRLGVHERRVLDAIVPHMKDNNVGFSDAVETAYETRSQDLYSMAARGIELMSHNALNGPHADKFLETIPSHILNEILPIFENLTGLQRGSILQQLKGATSKRSNVAIKNLENLLTYGDPNLQLTRESNAYKNVEAKLNKAASEGLISRDQIPTILTSLEKQAWRYAMDERVYDPTEFFEFVELTFGRDAPKTKKPDPDAEPIEPEPGETPTAPEPTHAGGPTTIETDFGERKFGPSGGKDSTWSATELGTPIEFVPELNEAGFRSRDIDNLRPGVRYGEQDPVLFEIVRGNVDGPWRLGKNEAPVSDDAELFAVVDDPDGTPIAAVFLYRDLEAEVPALEMRIRASDDYGPRAGTYDPSIFALAMQAAKREFDLFSEAHPNSEFVFVIAEEQYQNMLREDFNDYFDVDGFEVTGQKAEGMDGFPVEQFIVRRSSDAKPVLDEANVTPDMKQRVDFLKQLEEYHEAGHLHDTAFVLINAWAKVVPDELFHKMFLQPAGPLEYTPDGVILGSWHPVTGDLKINIPTKLHDGPIERFADLDNAELFAEMADSVDAALDDILPLIQKHVEIFATGSPTAQDILSILQLQEDVSLAITTHFSEVVSEFSQRLIAQTGIDGWAASLPDGSLDAIVAAQIENTMSTNPKWLKWVEDAENAGQDLSVEQKSKHRTAMNVLSQTVGMMSHELKAHASPVSVATTFIHEMVHAMHYTFLPEVDVKGLRRAYLEEVKDGLPNWARREQFAGEYLSEETFGEWLADTLADYLITKELPRFVTDKMPKPEQAYWKRTFDAFVRKLRQILRLVVKGKATEEFPVEIIDIAERIVEGKIPKGDDVLIATRDALATRGRLLSQLVEVIGQDISRPTSNTAKAIQANNKRVFELIEAKAKNGEFENIGEIGKELLAEIGEFMAYGYSFEDAVKLVSVMGPIPGDPSDFDGAVATAWRNQQLRDSLFGPFVTQARMAPDWVQSIDDLPVIEKVNLTESIIEQYGLSKRKFSTKQFRKYLMSGGHDGSVPREISHSLHMKHSYRPTRGGEYKITYNNPRDVADELLMTNEDVEQLFRVFSTGSFGGLFAANGRLISRLMGAEWYHQFAKNFDHVGKTKPVLTPGGAAHASEVFEHYANTLETPDGISQRVMDDLYSHLQDFWIKHRTRALSTIEPTVRAWWDRFLRPDEALASDVSDMTSKVGRTFERDHIRLETDESLREEAAKAQAQKRAFYQVDRRLDNVLQALGYRPGQQEVDILDLFSRLVGYVSGEHARKTFGHPTDMVPMTSRTVVPKNRVKDIQRAVDKTFFDVFGHSNPDGNYNSSTDTWEFNEFEAEGLRVHIRSLAREPLGASVLDRPIHGGPSLTDWNRDLTTITNEEFQLIRNATIDVLSGPAARQTSYTDKIPKSLGYAAWNGFKSQGAHWLEKFGPDDSDNVFTKFRAVLRALKTEEFAGGDLSPEAVESLREIVGRIGDVDKDFRALIMRALKSYMEIGHGELFEFFEHMFQAPVDPSKVGRLLGTLPNKSKGIEFVKPFRERFDGFVEEMNATDYESDFYVPKEPKEAVDPISDTDVEIEEDSMLLEILDSLEELQDIIEGRDLTGVSGSTIRKLRPKEREAFRILGIYRRKAYKAFEEGKVPEFSDIDRRAMANAMHRLRRSVKEKEEAVIQRGRVILAAFVGGMNAEGALKHVLDIDLGHVYSLFYKGEIKELMKWVGDKFKTETGTKHDTIARFDPGLATIEVMARLRCMDIVEELNRVLLRNGFGFATWDVEAPGSGRILDQSGLEFVGMNEDLYFQRVLDYLNGEQHYKMATQVFWKEEEGPEGPELVRAGVETPRAPTAGATTEGIFPSDEISRVKQNFFPVDEFDNVHDMYAYETAMRILERLGMEPAKRGFELWTAPNGEKMFLPTQMIMEIENAYDRVSRIGGAYGPRAAVPAQDKGLEGLGYDPQRTAAQVGPFNIPNTAKAGMTLNASLQTLADYFPFTFRNVRMGVTTGIGLPNPAYYMGVGMGGFFQMFQGMGAVGTFRALFQNAEQTRAIVAALYKDGITKNGRRVKTGYVPTAQPLVTKAGMVYNIEQLIRLAEIHGLKSSFVHAETIQDLTREIRTLFPSAMPKGLRKTGRAAREWQRTLVESATAMDNYYRVSIFLDYLNQGYTPAKAAERARKFLYDYADLSEAEKKVGRNLIMFYSYMRKNLDHFWETLLTNPERLIGQLRLVRGVQQVYMSEDAELVLRDYQLGRLPLFIRDTQVNTARAAQVSFITPPLPMMDVLNLYVDLADSISTLMGTQNNQQALRGITSRLMPHYQAPFVFTTNQDLFYDRSLDDYNKVPPWLVELDRAITGGLLVDSLFDVQLRSHLDQTRADVVGLPEEGWFHARNGRAWWVWRNLIQVPISGRGMDTMNWLDRSNIGAVEMLVRTVRGAAKAKGGPLVRFQNWSDYYSDPERVERYMLDDPMRHLGPRINMFELTITDEMTEPEIRAKAHSIGIKNVDEMSLNDLILAIQRKQAEGFSISELLGYFGVKPVYVPSRGYVRRTAMRRAIGNLERIRKQADLGRKVVTTPAESEYEVLDDFRRGGIDYEDIR